MAMLRELRSNNNESGNTKKNCKGGSGNKIKFWGGNVGHGNDKAKKLRCLVPSIIVE